MLPFGKYAEVPLDEVPDDYLGWVRSRVRSASLRAEVEVELLRRGHRYDEILEMGSDDE